MRRALAVCGGVLLAAAWPAAAWGEAGYEATWVTQSPANGTVLETGEDLPASVTFRNTGTKPWKRPLTRLGPSGKDATQRDRRSDLQAPSWIARNRITAVSEEEVPVGEEGTFRFAFRGPPVSSEENFREIVAPLHDGPVGDQGWMDNGPTFPFGFVYYDLVVRPSVPPVVNFDAVPPAVIAGQSVPVTATATDNVRIAAVSARIDNGPVVALDGAEPAQGAVPTTGIAPGEHTVTVAAADGAGNVTVTSAPLQVSADTGLPNGTPAGPATLTAGLSSKGRPRLTVGPGRRALLTGRLRVPDTKAPIAGARVDVQTRVQGTSRWSAATPVTTAPDGRYRLRLGKGPSRAIRVSYRALTLQADPTATRTVRVQTRAPVRLKARLRRRTLRMSGRVPGKPFPRGGVLVSLQALQAGDGRWRPFKTVRARGKKQRFAGRQRFDGRGRFRIRAVVNEQPGYPYTRGISNVRRVSVR